MAGQASRKLAVSEVIQFAATTMKPIR
jgi:hypothetical protein